MHHRMSWSPDNPRYCAGCRKAKKACICDRLQPFRNRIPIDFVVSAEEQARARTTSWLAHRLLEQSSFQAADELPEPAPTAAILYPSEDALLWSELPQPGRLIVPDDTWDRSRALLREHPRLQNLPRVRLAGSYQGRSQVRRAPKPGALSTAEAVGYFLLEQGEAQAERLIELIDHLNQREQHYKGNRRPGLSGKP